MRSLSPRFALPGSVCVLTAREVLNEGIDGTAVDFYRCMVSEFVAQRHLHHTPETTKTACEETRGPSLSQCFGNRGRPHVRTGLSWCQSLWGSRSSQCSHGTVSHIFEKRGRLRIGTTGVVLRLGDVLQFGFWTLAVGKLSLSRCTALVQVELDRKQFFALMPESSRTRARSAKSLPKSTFSAIGDVGFKHAASDNTLG